MHSLPRQAVAAGQGQTTMEHDCKPSPAWAYVATYAAILLSFGLHIFSLDRYPLPYLDEAFFNYPAVRYLEGKGLNYNVSMHAPSGESLWAYHGPFFPRLQVVTFRVFGISEWSCRLPQFLGAHLAIALLCWLLLRMGLFRAALIMAVAWLGDRSSLEVLFGRMEGIYLFCLASGFVCLVQAFSRGSRLAAAGAGVLLTGAVGFHPATVLFPLGCFLLLAILPHPRRLPALLYFLAGSAVTVGLVLVCWLPSIPTAVEQFLWNASLVGGTSVYEEQSFSHSAPTLPSWIQLIRVLRWSRYWVIGLVIVSAAFLVPLAFRLRWRRQAANTQTDARVVFVLATAFSVIALLTLMVIVRAAIRPYYLVLFSVWPVLALAVLAELGLQGGMRKALTVVYALLLLAWVPSFAWNMLRVRESLLYFRQLNPQLMIEQLHTVIPWGARVTGSPDLFVVAKQAELNFTPFPWYPEPTPVPPNAFLVLTDADPKRLNRVQPGTLGSRVVIARLDAHPQAPLFRYPYTVFGPAQPKTGRQRVLPTQAPRR